MTIDPNCQQMQIRTLFRDDSGSAPDIKGIHFNVLPDTRNESFSNNLTLEPLFRFS